jgi:hypothetical protein
MKQKIQSISGAHAATWWQKLAADLSCFVNSFELISMTSLEFEI